jgi:UTP--glucose-1-phosphate uridylyltransferase
MIAVIPAAGLGTRLLPLTKSVPKELLPAGDRPALQRVLEEVRQAGIREVVIVTTRRKPSLRHFLNGAGRDESLRAVAAADVPSHFGAEEDKRLQARERLAGLERLLKSLRITLVEQPAPLGLRDAVWRCRRAVGSRAFALLMPDNLTGGPELLRRLSETHAATGLSCVAVYAGAEGRRRLKTASFVFATERARGGIARVREIRPARAEASAREFLDSRRESASGRRESSDTPRDSLRVGIGRSVFAGGAIALFDPKRGALEENEVRALNALAADGALLAVESAERIWDIGQVEGYLAAFAHFARGR